MSKLFCNQSVGYLASLSQEELTVINSVWRSYTTSLKEEVVNGNAIKTDVKK